MKLEVGMYVRTKTGIIDKIIDTTEEYYIRENDEDEKLYKIYKINQDVYDDEFDEETNWCFEDFFIKASHNIIDLIEVGDYVNGFPVIHKENDILKCGLLVQFKENEIKSIVTKEQFEQMAYKVGE